MGGANSLGCNGRRGCEKGLPRKARDVSTQLPTMIMEGFASTERGGLLAVPIWHEAPGHAATLWTRKAQQEPYSSRTLALHVLAVSA